MVDRALFRFAVLLSFQQVYLRARRSVAAFVGVAGGIVLVMMQLGFQGALYDSAVRLHHSLDGDVIVVAREFRSIQDLTWFSREWLVALRAHPAVASVAPLYLSPIAVRSISDHSVRTLLGIGIDLGEPALKLDQLTADTTGLRVPGRILFDRKSQPNYGDIIGRLARAGSVEIETAFPATPLQSALTVIGGHTLGGTVVYYGTALLSAATLSSVTGLPLQRVNIGVVKLHGGAESHRVARELRSLLPQEASAMTAAEFVQLERRFWKNETPIGFLFNIGAVIGFLISATYIYQVLFQITEENLAEYAVLKTMGYPFTFFMIVVVSTAVILATVAFVPAVLLSQFLYWICIRATQLDLHLTPARVLGVGGLAILIAAGSGWLAARRLRRADPATLM